MNDAVHLNGHEETLGLLDIPWPVIDDSLNTNETMVYLKLAKLPTPNMRNIIDLSGRCRNYISVQQGSGSYIIILACGLVPPKGKQNIAHFKSWKAT